MGRYIKNVMAAPIPPPPPREVPLTGGIVNIYALSSFKSHISHVFPALGQFTLCNRTPNRIHSNLCSSTPECANMANCDTE